MKKNRSSKEEMKVKQIIEDKKFNKTMLIGFGLLFMFALSIMVFYTYWCDTKYSYRVYVMYGSEMPPNLICMNGNKLEHHESIRFICNDNIFYACSEGCKDHIILHYDKTAFVTDAFTGDTICKSDALIGLKEKGKPKVVYFENIQNLNNYYANIR